MELNDSSRAAGSSHPAIPRSVFPGSLGKLLPLPAAAPAPAAGYADFVGAADSNTAPTVAKPALFRQRVPWTNFPAWPGQPIVQPVFVEKSALPIFPLVGMAAAAPLSGPTVFSVKPWTVNRPDS